MPKAREKNKSSTMGQGALGRIRAHGVLLRPHCGLLRSHCAPLRPVDQISPVRQQASHASAGSPGFGRLALGLGLSTQALVALQCTRRRLPQCLYLSSRPMATADTTNVK